MRLSPFHLELAKRIAQGQPNREIMKDIQVSGSRLSVLKANPLFARAVKEYQDKEADKYTKAIEIFAQEAEDVAKEIVHLAKSPLTPHNIKLQAGVEVLDRLAQSEGQATGKGEGDEIVFEQMLRVTRRGLGHSREADSEDSLAGDSAYEDLATDLVESPSGVYQHADAA